MKNKENLNSFKLFLRYHGIMAIVEKLENMMKMTLWK